MLAGFSILFSLIAEQQFRVHNPFFWLTKTDVLDALRAAECADLLATSFSCTRVREATRTGKHCGLCSQCIDRRFAVLAAGLGHLEPPDRYAVDLLYGEREPGPDLTFAEGFVLAASKFATMSEPAFLSRYGQVYRALPFLEGSADRNAARVHEMHMRHGAAVLRVINDALTARATLPGALDLPEHSLLAMTSSATVRQLVDVEENESPASVQARSAPIATIERPILFAVDESNRRVLFPKGVKLTGPPYSLLKELFISFERDRGRNLRPEEQRYTDVHTLAARLGVTDATVRQNVRRARQLLNQQFKSVGRTIDADDVIQNDAWHGYRLNPFLAPTPVAHLDESVS